MFRLALWLVALTLVGAAHAHAYLNASTPVENSVVAELQEVQLVYSEPVEIRFSLFKVYPLELGEAAPADLSAVSDDELRRVSGLAGALVSEVLELRGDEEARADSGVTTTERTSQELALGLKETLEPGAYVVMWRVLSIDTHTTQGFFVFFYQPDAAG